MGMWGTADSDIIVPFCWEPIAVKGSGVGQNIAMHASPTDRTFFTVLISAFHVQSPLLLLLLLLLLLCAHLLSALVNSGNAVPHVGPRNKICHSARDHIRFEQVLVLNACGI